MIAQNLQEAFDEIWYIQKYKTRNLNLISVKGGT